MWASSYVRSSVAYPTPPLARRSRRRRTADCSFEGMLNGGILGRNWVDILKPGGYKVSALEIEEVLRSHPAIAECAVVGVPNEEWGEVVCAAIVPARPIEEQSLARWTAERLAPYKLPRRWLIVDDLPRNAMGKVTKPAVKEMFGV